MGVEASRERQKGGRMSVVGMKPHPKPQPVALDDLRCPICGKLLARARLVPGCVVELQCRNCRRVVLRECA